MTEETTVVETEENTQSGEVVNAPEIQDAPATETAAPTIAPTQQPSIAPALTPEQEEEGAKRVANETVGIYYLNALFQREVEKTFKSIADRVVGQVRAGRAEPWTREDIQKLWDDAILGL